MSGTLTRPDWAATIADLTKRIAVLERRLQPKTTIVSTGFSVDGAGDHSVAIAHSSDTVTASGPSSVAIGQSAQALNDSATAVGANAEASVPSSTALGTGASASGNASLAVGNYPQAAGDYSIAVGDGAQASGAYSATIGYLLAGTQDYQYAIGFPSQSVIVLAATNAAPSSDYFNTGRQICFYLDETNNLLKVKVKYAAGTFKTGSIALT